MADNYLPPINFDFGGLKLAKPADGGAEALRRLKGDGTTPPGTPPEVLRMLDDTGGDPALDTPQVFSESDASQLKQTPDPSDPATPSTRWDMWGGKTAESYAPGWASKDLLPDVKGDGYDPTFVDRAAKALGLPDGVGRLTPEEAAHEQEKRRTLAEQAALVEKLKAEQERELRTGNPNPYDGATFRGTDVPMTTPGERNAASLDAKAKGPQASLKVWRDFTERGLQSVLTGVVSLPRGAATAFDVPRALGAWVRGNPDLDQNAVAERLQKVSDDIKRAIPGDPTRNDEFVSQLGSGAGSFASFLAGGATLKALGIPFKAATAIAGASVGGTQQFDDARAHDATVTARYLAFVIGAGLGTTEAIPIDRALFWLNAKGGGVVSRVIATSTVSGLTELVQEVTQQLGQNVSAKILYDHSRDIFEGVGDAATVAFVLGTGFGMGAHSVQAINNRLAALRGAQERPPVGEGATGQPAAGSQPAANVAPGQGVLTEAAGPLAGQTVEVQGPTGDGAGYHVKLADGTETIMGRNAVELPPDVGLPAPAPTANSSQAPAAADQTQTEEFRRWFGDSKVVDEQGKPLVVYHGTPGPAFNIFDNAKTGITTFIGMPVETHRQGFYFAEKKGFAQGFADQARGRQRGAVMEVYLNIRNPLDVTSTDNASVARLERVAERMKEIDPAFNVDYIAGKAGYDSFWELLDTSEGGDVFVQAAKDLGYDGIKMIEPDLETSDPNYVPNSDGAVTWVSFDPTQIKSATVNSGAFDPSNPDITASVAPGVAQAQEPIVPPEQMQPLLPPGVTDLFTIAGKNGALVTGVPDAQPAPQDGDVSGIVRAYHGSPHTFDRFSMDKIGTGEGAQAYGHGLYFAESEGVARSYRDTLSAPRGESPEDIAGRVYEAFKQDRQGAIAELQRRVDSLERRRVEDPNSVPSDMRAGETALHKALAYLKSGATPGGALYEVVIDANPDDFLDWDKPLSQQPQALKDYLAKADLSRLPEGGRLRRTIEAYRKNPGDWVPPPGANIPEPMGHQVYDALTEYGGGAARNAALTKAMLDAGIPGVKYLDAGSRSKGDGSRNYVVFDENLVRIVKRNGQDVGGDVSAMQSPERPRASYPLERTRPASGIPEQQNLPAAEQSPSKKDISTRFKDAINLVVKQGRFNRGHSKAEAIYKWGQSVARVKSEGQMLELFHEGGHHLHSMLEPLLDPVITKHEGEIFKIADTLYGGGGVLKMNDIQGRRREGFATFFQVYMNNPAEARVIAPKFLPDFEALMEQDSPGIKKELDGIRQDVERWLLSKSSAQLARERVISNKKLGTIGKIVGSIKGGTVLHDIATLSNRVYQATLNDQHPLTLAVRKLRAIAEENIRVQVERGLLDRKGALTALENLARRGRADPVKMAALARNSYHASSEMIATGVAKYGGDGTAVSKGLAEIIRTATAKDGRVDQARYGDFNTYLAMRRIVSEWRNYYATLQWDSATAAGRKAKEPPVKRFRRPDDVSLGDAQQAVADLEKANPQFAQAASDVYTYLDELLQYKVDAGVLTQDEADRQRQIADYVPLRREMDDTKSGTLGNSKDARTGKDNLVRVFRGSERRILSPVESIMQMTHETVAFVAKNDVKKGLVQLALDVGRGSGAIVEQIPASAMKGTNVKLADVLKAAGDFSLADEIAQAMGRDEITMQEFMDEVLDGDEVGTIWRKTDISEKGDPIIYAWRDGEVQAFQLNDPEWADQLYSALTELGREQTNLAIQILGAPTAVLRAGITSSPPFVIANLVRDQFGAWCLNDGVYPGVSLGKGLASDLFDRKARRLYNLSMASIGGSNIAALDKTRFGTEQTMLAKAGIGVTAESSLGTALRVIESTETFSRQGIWQAAFKKAQADGLNIADAMIEAGFEASDYANYGRAGSKMLLARRLVTFLNANLQGLDKTLRTALGGEGGAAFLRKELAPWVRRQMSPAAAARLGLEGSQTSLPMTAQEKAQLARAGRTLSKMMVGLAIPSALLAMLYWDDEEYQDFSPYLKGTRWMVKIAPGKWLAIPKPFQLASFATFVEYSIDAVLRGDPTAMQKFMQSQAAVIAPPYENPAIKQFYELATNTDMFSGRPIVTPSVAARPNWLQYDEYTSEAGKTIGHWTGASPMIVDHVITGSFATWGRGFLSASNLLNPDRPAQGLDDFAFTSYFVKDGSRSSTVRPAFLDLVGQQQGQLTGAYSGYRELMDGGAAGQALDLLASFTDDQKVFAQLYYHQTADAKKLHPLRNAYDIAQTISGLRKELVVNRVRTGGKDDGDLITLSPTQQKLLNDRLSDLQVRVQRNALVVTGQPGFADRRILPTYPIVEQIKAIDPRIAADLKARMGSRIYTTDVVAQLWPKVRAEILAKGPKANLRPFVVKAKVAGNKIWTDGDTVQ